jgi:hypothetical protein
MTAIVRQAVTLVGGRGTRLGALAAQIPKPLIPVVGDRRFLDVLLDHGASTTFFCSPDTSAIKLLTVIVATSSAARDCGS